MTKALTTFFLSVIIISANAQNAKYTFSAAAGLYIGFSDDGSIGPGAEVKTARSISDKAQLTLSLALIQLRSFDKKLNNNYVHRRLIPVMVGYKRSLGKFYIEPKAGLGELGGKFSIGGDYSRPSVLAFFYSLNTGYSFKTFEVGLEINSGAIGISSPDAGFWYNRRLFYSALKIGFALSKGNSK